MFTATKIIFTDFVSIVGSFFLLDKQLCDKSLRPNLPQVWHGLFLAVNPNQTLFCLMDLSGWMQFGNNHTIWSRQLQCVSSNYLFLRYRLKEECTQLARMVLSRANKQNKVKYINNPDFFIHPVSKNTWSYISHDASGWHLLIIFDVLKMPHLL